MVASIGFTVARLRPEYWSNTGHTVTILVEPSPDCMPLLSVVEDCDFNGLMDACEHGDVDPRGERAQA